MKDEIYKQILTSTELQGKIMTATGKSQATIIRWARQKDGRLSGIEVLKAIKEHLQYNSLAELLQA